MTPVTAVFDALSVYVETLASDARVAVLGNAELGIAAQLIEAGARTVHLYDPDADRVARLSDVAPRSVSVRMLRDDFDVRDGAFDLVVIPDMSVLPDAASAVVRLRRVVDARGSVVAMARARTASAVDVARSGAPVFPELGPAVVEYAELYDLFALQFENVTMTGVVPFEGIVFAELGAGDDLAVSVDTRLAPADANAAEVFVVLASREEPALDPYAIVQVPSDDEIRDARRDTIAVGTLAAAADVEESERARDDAAAAAFAQIQLQAELLGSQLDEHRAKVAAAEGRAAEIVARIEQIALERDVALTRAAELEGILGAAQESFGSLERRLIGAERGMLERDDQIAALNAELDARGSAGDDLTIATVAAVVDPTVIGELLARVDRAEASLALNIADLAQISDAHATETASLEAQLQERARLIAEMDRELARREQFVRELVAALEEAREGHGVLTFEAAAAPAAPGHSAEDVARLRRKLDELALEIARREGELVAQEWRIAELESARNARPTASTTASTQASSVTPAVPSREAALEADLASTRDELDALRQALAQEHAARVAAESGEELTRARAELARQAALLDQIKGRSTHPEG